MKKVGNNVYFYYYDWYNMIEDSELKSKALMEKARLEAYNNDCDAENVKFLELVLRSFDDCSKLDQRMKWKLKKEWKGFKMDTRQAMIIGIIIHQLP